MALFSKSFGEKALFYGLNILTVLFIVTTVGGSGTQGSNGSNGLPGSTGPIGPSGPAGSDGEAGEAGEPGEPGEPGEDGEPGEPGADGQDGVSGGSFEYGSIEYAPWDFNEVEQEAYVQARIEEGYVAIDSFEDFELFHFTLPRTEEDMIEIYRDRYVLTTDLDFEEVSNPLAFIPGNQSLPFDNLTLTIAFNGVFDGAGFTISNYTRAETELNNESVAFFPYTEDAIIRNLNFFNAHVTGTDINYSTDTAVVVGDSIGELHLHNITVEDSLVVATDAGGGLVGKSTGLNVLANTHIVNSLVYGGGYRGGLIGYADTNYYDIIIVDSSNQGTDFTTYEPEVKDLFPSFNPFYTAYTGGFVGYIENADTIFIYNSMNTADISNYYSDIGGFIGYVDFVRDIIIQRSYNSGHIMAFEYGSVGGFIGQVNEYIYSIQIANSFNASYLLGADDGIGGFIGFIERDDSEYNPFIQVTNSYNAGTIIAMNENDYIGGFFGEIDDNLLVRISNSFNVGAFDDSFAENLSGTINGNVGAFIGESTSNKNFFMNSFYYVDTQDLSGSIVAATGGIISYGARQDTNLAHFTYEDFRLGNVWNFNDIWTFEESNYPFPVLQELGFSQDDTEIDLLPFGDVGFNGVSAPSPTTFTILNLSLNARDRETAQEALVVELYFFPSSLDGDVAAIEESGQLIESFEGGLITARDITFTSEFVLTGSTAYSLAFLITDNAGQTAIRYFQNLTL